MTQKERSYIAIDLKSFYASAECADRHLDPLTTNLVVADPSRTEKTICLAVSPSLKAYGIPGRARLFEVVQRVEQINAMRLQKAIRAGRAVCTDGKQSLAGESFDANALASDPSLKLGYIVAPPRMNRYMEISSQIYSVYLRFVSEEDIHVYSIDEVFIDATNYLAACHMTARELATTMIREVLYTTGITATAGIGTNLYLAKLAMDIVAKHIPADRDGVRIADLDERSYRYLLWNHKPLTDFWRTGRGTAAKLEKHGIHTMGELARASVYDGEWLYKTFGVDAEIMIDHAWGIEPCTIRQIKEYRPETNSLCEGQVLSEPYPFDKARIIVQEMTEALAFQMMDRNLAADSLTLVVNYDRENIDNGTYHGQTQVDFYGRIVPKSVHGTAKPDAPTNLYSQLAGAILKLYDRLVDRSLTIRRITIDANHVLPDTGIVQLDLFSDSGRLEREKRLQETVLSIKQKYHKNAILKGTSLEEGATMQRRNCQVGGHKA